MFLQSMQHCLPQVHQVFDLNTDTKENEHNYTLATKEYDPYPGNVV
jgi:hypothetical protein